MADLTDNDFPLRLPENMRTIWTLPDNSCKVLLPRRLLALKITDSTQEQEQNDQ
jgi:hypothetical protein